MPDTYFNFVIAYIAFWVILFAFLVLLQIKIGKIEKILKVTDHSSL